MHRQPLLDLLDHHRPFDAAEAESLRRTVAFVQEHANCFERSLATGHVTASAWIVSADGARVLLTHHRKLDKWLQLGGHADGDPDVLRVALREAGEESGLEAIEAVRNEVFDVDVHPIPARGPDPEHDHYDVRFLLRAMDPRQPRVSDESHDVRWMTREELSVLDIDASVLRMYRKWTDWLAGRLS